MKSSLKIIPLVLLVMGLVLTMGCGVGGGAEVSLEGVALGTVTMEGKPVTGLPSEKVNLLLEVSAQRVVVSASPETTVLTLTPSGATIEITAGQISIKGVKPGQMKVEWVTPKP